MAADTAPVPQLTCNGLLRLRPPLQACPDRCRPLFPRRDQAASFAVHAEGLLSGEQRKSVERRVLHQLNGDMNRVRRPRYFAADSPWSDRSGPTGRRWGHAGHARGHPTGTGGHDRHAGEGSHAGPPMAVPDRGLDR